MKNLPRAAARVFKLYRGDDGDDENAWKFRVIGHRGELSS